MFYASACFGKKDCTVIFENLPPAQLWRGRFNYLLNIIFSLLNIKLNTTTSATAKTRLDISASTKPSGGNENLNIADIASWLPKRGIANNPTEGFDKIIDTTPSTIISIINGDMSVPASFTLFANADNMEKPK